MKKQSQAGFAIVEVVVIAAVVVALSAASYLVWRQHSKRQPATTANVTSPAAAKTPPGTSVPSAPQVNKASDLNDVAQALDQTDMAANSTDSSQLSTQANGF